MIYTIEQANDHNTLLNIKERIEEKHKEGFNIINRMPRIKIMSNIEADNKTNKENQANRITQAYKESPVDEISPADKANPVSKINYRSQVGVVYESNLEIEIEFETSPQLFFGFSIFVFGLSIASLVTLAVRVLGYWLLPYSISICSVVNGMTNIALLRSCL